MLTSCNMAKIFIISHILLLFYLFNSTKYEKLRKYWSHCTRNGVIIKCVWDHEENIFSSSIWVFYGDFIKKYVMSSAHKIESRKNIYITTWLVYFGIIFAKSFPKFCPTSDGFTTAQFPKVNKTLISIFLPILTCIYWEKNGIYFSEKGIILVEYIY